jgi:hypothetical protein
MQMHPTQAPPPDSNVWFEQLVYDVNSDVTIGTFSTGVWAYDLQANAWSRKGSAVLGGSPAAYDPVSGLVVSVLGVIPGRSERVQLWNYDVETDTWTPIHQATAGPDDAEMHYQVAYDAFVDRLVLYGIGGSGTPPYDTWLFDIRTGTWTESRAERPAVGPAGPGLTGPRLVYDEAAERTLVFTWAPLTAYDASTDRWEILTGGEDRVVDPHQMEYDSVNRRLVGWGAGGAVEALDLVTGEWTVLLEPGEGQPSNTPAATPTPTSARTVTPSGGTEKPGLTSPVPTASPTATP